LIINLREAAKLLISRDADDHRLLFVVCFMRKLALSRPWLVLCCFTACAALRLGARAPLPRMASSGPPKGFGTKPPAGAASADIDIVAARSKQQAEQEAAELARGRAALEAMRAESGSFVPGKAQRAPEALTPEELAPVDPTEGVMPEAVSQRMLGRVVPFAGVPVFGAMLVFVGFWYANTQLELDLPPMIVAYTTIPLLLLSFAGITWGVMSTSLDEGEEGSLFGAEQAKKNVDMMRAGLESGRGEAAREQEMEDAVEAGVVMNRAAKRQMEKRERKANKSSSRENEL
jgi:hypothetical protein